MQMTINGKEFDAIYDVYPFIKSKKGDIIAFIEPDNGYVIVNIINLVSYESLRDKSGSIAIGDAITKKKVEKPPGKLASNPRNKETEKNQSSILTFSLYSTI